jgi:hypothetical protein
VLWMYAYGIWHSMSSLNHQRNHSSACQVQKEKQHG